MQHLVCFLSCILWINSCSNFFFSIILAKDIFKLTLEKHETCFFEFLWLPGKHGRGDAQGTPLPARPAASGHVDPTWVSSTRADASRFGFDARRREPIRADSGLNRPDSAGIGQSRPVSARIGRYRPESAGIGRNGRNSRFRPKFKKKKKKKKNPERTVLLNTNPTSAQIHSKRQNTLLTLLTVFYLVLISNLWVVF